MAGWNFRVAGWILGLDFWGGVVDFWGEGGDFWGGGGIFGVDCWERDQTRTQEISKCFVIINVCQQGSIWNDKPMGQLGWRGGFLGWIVGRETRQGLRRSVSAS